MRKQFGVSLAVIPLVLMVALLWARKRAWDKLEEEFRAQLLADATRSSDNSFTISVETTERSVHLGHWTPSQLKAALTDVHLQKASSPTANARGPSLMFEAFAGDVDPISGFYVFSGGGAGVIGGARTSPPFNDDWSKFEITPEASRVLERRVWKLYGAKLKSLHIPAPQ